MKVLILTTFMAILSLAYFAGDFVRQSDNYQSSSLCIAEKIAVGYDRDEITVVGGTCTTEIKR